MTLEKVLLYAERRPDTSSLQIQPTRNDQPTQPSNTPSLQYSNTPFPENADTPTRFPSYRATGRSQ
jgi:hypothetical protein